MKPNLILHIGTEKTGTSTIQEFLYQNRMKLEENGYHFLQCAGPKNNRALPAYVLNDTDSLNDDFFQLNGIKTIEGVSSFRNEFNKKINEEIKGLGENIHTVIISSEHFHSRVNKLESIQRLKDLTDTLFSKVTIICYLREQSQVCESWYSTALKNGHTSTFADFVSSCNKENIYFNYQRNLQNWIDIYGNKLIVKKFDTMDFFENNLLKDFTRVFSVNLIKNANYNISIENESLTPTGQHIIYAINNVIKKEKNKKNLLHAKKFTIDNFKGKGQKVTKKDYVRIKNEFKESNSYIFSKFDNLIGKDFKERDIESLPNEYQDNEKNKFLTLIKNLISITIDFSSQDTDRLRDIAIQHEKNGDYPNALYLMELAEKGRPSGPLITKKIKLYRERCNSEN